MEKIIITGGSGTVGESFISKNITKYEIYSYSRNEKAQVALKRLFPKVNIILGSVEDRYNLENAIRKVQPKIIIHAAALKHVDSAQKQPLELVKSNIIGSKNIIEIALKHEIPLTVGISTDKACDPQNLYGYSKKIMEQMFIEANNEVSKFCCTRFGNVAGSNGSVIPYWLNQKKNGDPLSLTDTNMQRLMLSQNEVSEIIEKCIEEGLKKGGFILSKKMNSVLMKDLALAISDNIKIVGIRDGEELNENLISVSELQYTEVVKDFIFIRNEINTNIETRLAQQLSSDNSPRMKLNELKSLVSFVKSAMKKQFNY